MKHPEFLAKIVDHGNAAVVTCEGVYEGPGKSPGLTFMSAWLKKDGRWQFSAAAVARASTE